MLTSFMPPVSRTLGITGHRPQRLGGFKDYKRHFRVEAMLYEKIYAFHVTRKVANVVAGGTLGS